jgi:uncharacterized membrane protein HdeD (DUF308 family)
MSLTNRIGCFFLLVGVFCVVLYLASDVAGDQNCSVLLIGVLGTVLGFAMWRRNRTAPTSSNRFSGIKKLRQKTTRRPAPPKR